MDDFTFEDVLKAFETQLSRIEDVKNTLHNLEEQLDVFTKRIKNELLKPKKSVDARPTYHSLVSNDFAYDLQEGMNYITVGELTYQFVFVAKSLEIKSFRVIKPIMYDKKEVENAS